MIAPTPPQEFWAANAPPRNCFCASLKIAAKNQLEECSVLLQPRGEVIGMSLLKCTGKTRSNMVRICSARPRDSITCRLEILRRSPTGSSRVSVFSNVSMSSFPFLWSVYSRDMRTSSSRHSSNEKPTGSEIRARWLSFISFCEASDSAFIGSHAVNAMLPSRTIRICFAITQNNTRHPRHNRLKKERMLYYPKAA